MLMNLFNVSGPEFLRFYFVFGLLTLVFVWRQIRRHEAKWTVPDLKLTDPYEIAMLRGGENEALRVATISLIDRGLLEVSGNEIKSKSLAAVDHARRSIEKAIIRKFSAAGKVTEIYKDDILKATCAAYRNSLGRNRLLASDAVYRDRLPIVGFGLLVIGGLAAMKIFVAVEKGRLNIWYLLILAGIFLFCLYKFYFRERTSLGDRVLNDLRTLFEGLKNRRATITPGGLTNEATLLAAVFGVSELSPEYFPYVEELFPKASEKTLMSNSSNCGSSCGSACGSSCGGGDSGGCGGCGGD